MNIQTHLRKATCVMLLLLANLSAASHKDNNSSECPYVIFSIDNNTNTAVSVESKKRSEFVSEKRKRSPSLTRSYSDPTIYKVVCRDRQVSMQALRDKALSQVFEGQGLRKRDSKKIISSIAQQTVSLLSVRQQNVTNQVINPERSKCSRYGVRIYSTLVALLAGALLYVGLKLYDGCEQMQGDCNTAKTLMSDCKTALQDTSTGCEYWGQQIIAKCLAKK